MKKLLFVLAMMLSIGTSFADGDDPPPFQSSPQTLKASMTPSKNPPFSFQRFT